MQWPAFEQTYRNELNQHKEFTEVPQTNNNNAKGLWGELKKRVVEHVSISFQYG